MYIQDFPRIGFQQSMEELPSFAKELLFFIRRQNLPSNVLNKLCEYNFTRSSGIEFVHSISGDHLDHLDRIGKNSLASALTRLDLKPQPNETLQLCYVLRNSTTENLAQNNMFILNF